MTLEEAKELPWGTRGIGGKNPLKYMTLGELETDHLENIITHIWETRDLRLPDAVIQYTKACQFIITDRKKSHLPNELFEVE